MVEPGVLGGTRWVSIGSSPTFGNQDLVEGGWVVGGPNGGAEWCMGANEVVSNGQRQAQASPQERGAGGDGGAGPGYYKWWQRRQLEVVRWVKC